MHGCMYVKGEDIWLSFSFPDYRSTSVLDHCRGAYKILYKKKKKKFILQAVKAGCCYEVIVYGNL